MSNVLYVDLQNNSIWSCAYEEGKLPEVNDSITINGTHYKVSDVETIVESGKVSYKIFLV